MGIQGLLPLLHSITESCHISEYEGKVVAVDSFCWLHKASYSCASDLVLGKPTLRWLPFCKHRIEMMLFHNVTPVVVFDGGSLPMKRHTNQARREAREKARKKAMAHLEAGNRDAAETHFRQAVSITWEMSRAFQQYLREVGVDYVVAPYEADAQLAYMSRNGLVDAVITEDSDLIAFGCSAIIVKMDRYGQAKRILFEHLGNITKPSLVNFDLNMFRCMCILSGCDYVESIPGVGLKKAHALVKQHKTFDRIMVALRAANEQFMRKKRASKAGRSGAIIKPKYRIPNAYEERFRLADMTFKHQLVWDDEAGCMVPLTPLEEALELTEAEMEYLGPMLEPELAFKVCSGEVHPHSHKTWEEYEKERRARYAAQNPNAAAGTPRQGGAFGVVKSKHFSSALPSRGSNNNSGGGATFGSGRMRKRQRRAGLSQSDSKLSKGQSTLGAFFARTSRAKAATAATAVGDSTKTASAPPPPRDKGRRVGANGITIYSDRDAKQLAELRKIVNITTPVSAPPRMKKRVSSTGAEVLAPSTPEKKQKTTPTGSTVRRPLLSSLRARRQRLSDSAMVISPAAAKGSDKQNAISISSSVSVEVKSEFFADPQRLVSPSSIKRALCFDHSSGEEIGEEEDAEVSKQRQRVMRVLPCKEQEEKAAETALVGSGSSGDMHVADTLPSSSGQPCFASPHINSAEKRISVPVRVPNSIEEALKRAQERKALQERFAASKSRTKSSEDEEEDMDGDVGSADLSSGGSIEEEEEEEQDLVPSGVALGRVTSDASFFQKYCYAGDANKQ